MQMFVKSAHTVSRTHHSLDVIWSTIKKRSPELTIEPSQAMHIASLYVLHEKSLERSLEPPSEDYRPLLRQCCNKDQEVISSSLETGSLLKTIRHSVPLTVEPSLTIGALKSILKPISWIPNENLILIQRRGSTPLEDDSSTLNECGIKDEDTLLTCMAGSFTVKVRDPKHNRKPPITVSSCFETIGDVKEKIHQTKGYAPKHQVLHFRKKRIDGKDGLPLVALGIVRPYLKEIEPEIVVRNGLSSKKWIEPEIVVRNGRQRDDED